MDNISLSSSRSSLPVGASCPKACLIPFSSGSNPFLRDCSSWQSIVMRRASRQSDELAKCFCTTGERLCFTFPKPRYKSRTLSGQSGPVASSFQAAKGMPEKIFQTFVVNFSSNNSRSPGLTVVTWHGRYLYQSPILWGGESAIFRIFQDLRANGFVAARRLLIEARDFEAKAEIRRIKLRKAACQREFPLQCILMKTRVGCLASSENVLGQVLRLPARFCGIGSMRTPIRGCEAWVHIHT
jgi:hypothetical protein